MALLHFQAWKLKSARRSECVTPAMMRRLRGYGSPESVEPGGAPLPAGREAGGFFCCGAVRPLGRLIGSR